MIYLPERQKGFIKSKHLDKHTRLAYRCSVLLKGHMIERLQIVKRHGKITVRVFTSCRLQDPHPTQNVTSATFGQKPG
jgi:hypothetical protein